MHSLAIAAAALLATGNLAMAQTTTHSAGQPAAPRPADAAAPAATAPVQRAEPNPLHQEDVSQIEGTDVYGGDNDKIGHISTVLMNPESKQIERLVVTAGGVLGIGGRRVAIPIQKFAWDSGKGVFRLPMTTANLKTMPEWAEGSETATGSSTPPSPEPPPAAGGSQKPAQ